MSRNTTSCPRMLAVYAPGTARHALAAGMAMATCASTVRSSGWMARADLTGLHPIRGRALPRALWWIIETKE